MPQEEPTSKALKVTVLVLGVIATLVLALVFSGVWSGMKSAEEETETPTPTVAEENSVSTSPQGPTASPEKLTEEAPQPAQREGETVSKETETLVWEITTKLNSGEITREEAQRQIDELLMKQP